MSTFSLQVVTPERVFFSGDASMVIAPGSEGVFGVLIGHAPFISSLKPGVIEVEREGQPNLRIAVIEGIAEATPERCVILAETAKALEDITPAQAADDVRAAEEAVQAALSEEQQQQAAKKLLMAQTVASALKAA